MSLRKHRLLKKAFAIMMIVTMLTLNVPIIPRQLTVTTNVEAANLIRGITEEQIVESCMHYINDRKYTYENVGTCTGFVTRVYNRVGITEVVGTHPYNIEQTQSGGGAKYAPSAMYRNAKNLVAEGKCIQINQTPIYRGDAINIIDQLQTGDIAITRPQDKDSYTGDPNDTGHVGIIGVENGKVYMYEAITAGLRKTLLGSEEDGKEDKTRSKITIFRLFESSYSIKIQKLVNTQDVEESTATDVTPEGCEFTVYSDSDCTQVVDKMITDASGNALLENLGEEEYWVKETACPENLVLDPTVYHVTSDGVVDGVFTITSTNGYKTVKVGVTKQDLVTGRPQGDGLLRGAVYGLYSDSGCTQLLDTTTIQTDGNAVFPKAFAATGTYWVKEITPPQGYHIDEGVYTVRLGDLASAEEVSQVNVLSKDKVITGRVRVVKYDQVGEPTEKVPAAGAVLRLTLNSNPSVYYETTIDDDGNGEFIDENNRDRYPYTIPYGTYTITEVKGSDSGTHTHYYIDPQTVRITRQDQEEYYILDDEFVEMYLKLQKIDKETNTVVELPGAKFKVWDCRNNEFVKARIENTGEIVDEFETDETGAITIPQKLKAGEYIIYETKAPEGYILNPEYKLPDSSSQYGNKEGTGKYVLIDKEAMELEEDAQNQHIDLYYVSKMADESKKVKLEVKKSGEVLTDATMSSTNWGEKYTPKYEERALPNVEYKVYAAEDIKTPDGKAIYNHEGDLVDTIVTGPDGMATTKELHIGKYKIVESKTPEGYITDNNIDDVTLENNEEGVDVKTTSIELKNVRQKLAIEIDKKFEDVKYSNVKEIKKKATFGVYANQDFVNYQNTKVISKNDLVATIDVEEGVAQDTSKMDLPIGNYTVRELETVYPYTASDEVKEVTLRYEGNEEPIIVFGVGEFINTPETSTVTLIKLSTSTVKDLLLNGENVDYDKVDKEVAELIKDLQGMSLEEAKEYLEKNKVKFVPGAVYGIYTDEECKQPLYMQDENKQMVEAQMVSDTNGIISMGEVPLGTYYFKELKAPEGYQLSKEIIKVELTLDNKNAVIYQALIEDSEISKQIDKKDIFTGDSVANCVFEIKDLDDNVLLHSKTNEKGEAYIPLDIFEEGETYQFVEVEAPGIYDLNTEPHEFTAHFDENGKWAAKPLEVQNRRKTLKGSLTIRKVDDETGEPLEGCKFSIVLLDKEGNPYVNEAGETVYLVENAVTDEDGEYIIDKVPYGTYKFIEVEAPEGYEKVEEEMENYVFTIDENSSDDIIFEVTNTGDIAVYALVAVAIVCILGIVFVIVRNKKRQK